MQLFHLYAHATIEPLDENKIILEAIDRRKNNEFDLENELPIDGTLDLLKGVYNRIQKDYGIARQGFRLSTFVDAPAGSGLGHFFYSGGSHHRRICRNASSCHWVNMIWHIMPMRLKEKI